MRRRSGAPVRRAVTMMPIGVPRVPYRTPGENSWQWVDLWNCLYRERIIFVGQGITEELGNQARSAFSPFQQKSRRNGRTHPPPFPGLPTSHPSLLGSPVRYPSSRSCFHGSAPRSRLQPNLLLKMLPPSSSALRPNAQLVGTMLFLDSTNQKDMYLYIHSMARLPPGIPLPPPASCCPLPGAIC